MTLAKAETCTKATYKVQGVVSNAKQTVVQCWMSTCTIRKKPGSFLAYEPEISTRWRHVVHIAHDVLEGVICVIEENISNN
eukprot:12882387-Prorocentrum_lima.AAC.1